ncbi:MAG: pyridoxal-phosphate dependent enzyme [Gemmatimonadota bacterium]|nr:pyridoxal-phosphate dependent enzyme [Gemmatimonadota bacterium]MDE2863789.1 pyridoxal-phosphate dependent enzyme [Gemmatimonadota bacterium]MYB06162.1 pyridoxal-phosphate dependent enzyme [Gemmatimonadota bacterium]MYG23261.1 pyridoxal-phosphate dependent enzyme [Gemmatimonadota bacterium]MYJ37829.1 pyridoxal-phosphate dependent enzyme [Gemmatimonadota bacterium]
MRPVRPVALDDIHAARSRIEGSAIRSPLIRVDIPESPVELWVKLECLQPIGSFKVRGAANAMALADDTLLAGGVYTGSAGNMAQGVAFAARRLGVPCRVVVPDTAPRAKLDAIARLGATAAPLPFDEWWSVLRDHGHPGEQGYFVHPVSDPAVIAGNGTIGLEIVEELPRVRAVVVPYGGGGLSCGIAAALRELAPGVPVFAAEVETAAPFAASLRAGRPVEVRYRRSFVDGIGSSSVLEEMWPLASTSLAGSLVVSLEEVCEAIRVLAGGAHIVAEGAGATGVAAALRGLPGIGDGPVVAVVSGGNIDPHVFQAIMEGRFS